MTIKRLLIVFSALLLSFSISLSAQNNKAEEIKLSNKTDSLSYALGQSVTNGLKQYLIHLEILKEGEVDISNNKNFTAFLKGLQSALGTTNSEDRGYNAGVGIGQQLALAGENYEKEMLIDEKLNKEIFTSSIIAAINEKTPLIGNSTEYLQEHAIKSQEAINSQKAEKRKAEYADQIAMGTKFLDENKTKEGIKTLPSGLQYKIIKEGDGNRPLRTDRVTVHYEGRLLDGTIFDSSYKRDSPSTFGVTQVIKGWTEVLQIMPVGSKWTVYIPYDLAYGETDQGTIKPFSTLIFDIELLDIAE